MIDTRLFAVVIVLCCILPICGWVQPSSQSSNPSTPISCSPAPCILPPTQASEGGAEVADAPIISDPLDPAHLLLGSTDFNCQYGLGFFTSSNGGSTWDRTCLVKGIGVYQPSGEPMVGYDRKGTAYIAGVYVHAGYERGVVGVQSSTDGINWSNPVLALQQGLEPFYPWLVADVSPNSPNLNTVYISAVADTFSSAQLFVSHSNNSGKTWTQVAVAPAQTGKNANDYYTNMTIGKDGTVYLAWMYCSDTGSCGTPRDTAYMVLSKSGDGGNTWSQPTVMTEINLGPGMLPNTNIGIAFYPVIGIDNSSGPYSGTLYAAMWTWTGSYMRVQVVHSSDGGTTWSKPVPVAPPSANHDQFFPWLSVSPTALVGVSWLDRRNDPANINYQAFAAISSDGGQSFQPNIQLTTKFSNPNNNGYPDNGWMGDYTGNTWAGPNYFIAAWMDSSNGVDMQDVVGGIRLH